MAFFDDIGRKLSATSQTMVNKAKGAADITGLKVQISNEEKKLEMYYRNLGKTYYELQKECAEPQVQELVDLITKSFEKIEETKRSINAIESVRICPSCGAVIGEDAVFCVGCGTKIDKEE
ncbi:MAG: zinc-ribbon domain-containing protein [Lachnospiraceae bacterium]